MANGTLNSRSFQIRAGTMMNSLTPSNNPSFSSEGKFLPLDDLLAALYRHCEVFLPTTRQHGAARAEQLQLCGSTGARGLRRTVHHVARPAMAQIKAPTVIAHGTPTACERKPDSRPPTGIMPPSTSVQMPITRPRIASETLVWMSVFVVEK